MSAPPQLSLESRLPDLAGAPEARATPTAHVRRRKRRPDRAMTSFEMTAEERELLGRIAAERGMSIGAVLREGLALVAQKQRESPKAA